MASSFLDLNLDIRLHIMLDLDAVSLIRCATTCKALYETFQNSLELACTVHLYLDGLEYGDTNISSIELLECLRLRRESQKSFEWSGYESILLSSEGSLSTVTKNRKHILELLEWNTSSNDLQCLIGCLTLRTPANFLAIDASQDVLAWLDGEDPLIFPGQNVQNENPRIRIQTLSTGLPHPLASKDVLEFFDPFDILPLHTAKAVTVQIVRDSLSFFLHLSGKSPRIIIWNWMTSYLLYDSGYEPHHVTDPHNYPLAAFTLLSATCYLVTSNIGAGSINLYTLVLPHSQHEHETPHLASGAQYGKTIHVAALHLPPTVPGRYSVGSLATGAGPISAGPIQRHPYKQREEDRLHMFEIPYYRTDRHEPASWVILMVHCRIFMAYLNRNQETIDLNYFCINVPWAEWGPWNTRMIAATEELGLDCGSG